MFGITDTAQRWFKSYLNKRNNYVAIKGSVSR